MTAALVKAGLSVPHQIAFAVRRARHGVNGRRVVFATCRSGHRWTPANTYVWPDGKRMCRACRAVREGRLRAKRLRARALRLAHPDTGGSKTEFRRVFRAYEAQT